MELESEEVRSVQPPIHLVVVELHHHGELIRNLVEVLGGDQFRISIVSLPKVIEDAGLDAVPSKCFSAYTLNSGESVGSFIARMQPVFECADILYFNTIRHYWDELSQIEVDVPSIARVHNAHCDLAPCHHFHRPIVNFFGILSHLVRKVMIGGEWRSKRNLYRNIDYFMFPNQAITEYVARKDWLPAAKILPPVLPFGYLGPEPKVGGKAGNEVRIAITGKVTNTKKDFDLVYRALKKCLQEFERPVSLVLLGKAADKDAKAIVARFKSLVSSRFSIDYSDCYLPVEEFERKVQAVDFILAPIQINTHFRKYHEVYGKSKASGIDVDLLLYRKPTLVVSGYQMKGAMANVVEYFNPTPDHLAKMLVRWVNEGTYASLANNFNQLSSFHPGEINNTFYRLCQDLRQAHGVT